MVARGRGALAWAKVNGGVVLCAALSHGASKVAEAVTNSPVAAAAAATASLYALVYMAAAINLTGRRRSFRKTGRSARREGAPVAFWSIVWHPLGACVERLAHEHHRLAPAAYELSSLGGGLLGSALLHAPLPLQLLAYGGAWWVRLACKLLAFELVFDFLFYLAHRAVHAHPLAYKHIHKLHHQHTHDVRLLSALQSKRVCLPLEGKPGHTTALTPLTCPRLLLSRSPSVAHRRVDYSHAAGARCALGGAHTSRARVYAGQGVPALPGALRPRGRPAQGSQLWARAVYRRRPRSRAAGR